MTRTLPHRPGAPSLRVLTALVAAGVAVSATQARAQSGGWPTLSGAGVEYISRSGFFQASLSGQLDLEAVYVRHSWAGLVVHEGGEGPLPDDLESCARCHVGMGPRGEGGGIGAQRLRVFADLFLGDHVYSLVVARSDRGQVPSDGDIQTRLEQAYVRVQTEQGTLALQVGSFASPFGAYPQRHLTTDDPFMRPPLSYDYRTVMSRTLVPGSSERLVRWKDSPELFRKPGAPPVWDVPYQWGAMALARVGPLDVRVAAMNSAPSSEPDAWRFEWDRFQDPSWVAAVRSRLSASLDIGASYSRGPWMEEIVAGAIQPPDTPAGAPAPSFRDFAQELASVDFRFARGAMMLRGEAKLDRWAVPNIEGRPTELGYDLELQWDLAPGLSVATRVGRLDFRPLAMEGGTDPPVDWDYDVWRYEASVGYRLLRNVGMLLSAYEQTQQVAIDGDTFLMGLRLWWAF
jgi:hypothetical protein